MHAAHVAVAVVWRPVPAYAGCWGREGGRVCAYVGGAVPGEGTVR